MSNFDELKADLKAFKFELINRIDRIELLINERSKHEDLLKQIEENRRKIIENKKKIKGISK